MKAVGWVGCDARGAAEVAVANGCAFLPPAARASILLLATASISHSPHNPPTQSQYPTQIQSQHQHTPPNPTPQRPPSNPQPHPHPHQAKLVDNMSLSDVMDTDTLMRQVAESQLGPLLQSMGSEEDPYNFFLGAFLGLRCGSVWGL